MKFLISKKQKTSWLQLLRELKKHKNIRMKFGNHKIKFFNSTFKAKIYCDKLMNTNAFILYSDNELKKPIKYFDPKQAIKLFSSLKEEEAIIDFSSAKLSPPTGGAKI